MPSRAEPSWQQSFTQARREFDRWRRTRPRGARIPAQLWRTAVALAQRHGVSKTASALGLDYYAVKKRLTRVAPREPIREDRPASFVELPPGCLSPSGTCVLELERPKGSRLRLELQGFPLSELERFVRSLLDDAR